MFNDLPQFVKQQVCLNCDGCCRFKEGEQSWHAKIGIDEVYELQRDKPSLAREVFQRAHVTADGFFSSQPDDAGCRCVFFDNARKACSIYGGHPFECRLYPFVIRRRGKEVVLSCHLACPFIQDAFGGEDYDAYVCILRDYFQRQDVLEFIATNPHIPGQYDAYADELEDVLVLDMPGDVKGDGLLSQRWIIEHALMNVHPLLAQQSYAALHLWQDFYRYETRLIGDSLCIFAHDQAGCYMPLPPLGEYMDTVTEKCFEYMRERNGNGGVSRIENVSATEVENYRRDGYAVELKDYDTCYYRKDLIGYHGNLYKSQRAARNHFLKNYAYKYRSYTSADSDACRDLFARWQSSQKVDSVDDMAQQMLSDNLSVHQRAFTDYAVMGLVGRVVEADGSIAAYTFGHRISDQMFCVALEVADHETKGLSEFLFHEFCADEAVESYKFINVMDSFALPRVLQTKMFYHPALLSANYTVTRNR